VTPNYFAPAPGSRSGVADYAERLRIALESKGPIPVPLYHLGNNQLHAEIYRQALESHTTAAKILHRGVVVMHDAVLHHFLLGSLTRELYIEEFVYNYGEWQRQLAEELWADRGSSGTDPRYFRYPMIRRVVERARAVIVHNPGAAAIVREHGGDRIVAIPHFYEPGPVDAAEIAYFRDRLNIAQGATLFGIFGYLRETKRILPALNAFRRLHHSNPNTALVLAGDAVSNDLRQLLRVESDTAPDVIHRLGHLEETDFRTAAAAVDCCINLRYPAAGETSGIAIRLMGAGKPVIVTEDAATSDIPQGACLPVRPGIAEPAELFEHMNMVAAFPSIAKEVGRAAARHIAKYHSIEEAARMYWQVLCESQSS
jgi:glycosyltransferase involved in cell wall biosynthesis